MHGNIYDYILDINLTNQNSVFKNSLTGIIIYILYFKLEYKRANFQLLLCPSESMPF